MAEYRSNGTSSLYDPTNSSPFFIQDSGRLTELAECLYYAAGKAGSFFSQLPRKTWPIQKCLTPKPTFVSGLSFSSGFEADKSGERPYWRITKWTKSTRVLCLRLQHLPMSPIVGSSATGSPITIVSIVSSKLIGSFAANKTSSRSINGPADMLENHNFQSFQ